MNKVLVASSFDERRCFVCEGVIKKEQWHYLDADSYKAPPDKTYNYYCLECSEEKK